MCLDVGVTIMMLAGLHVSLAWIGTIVFYVGAILAVYSGINYVVKINTCLNKTTNNRKKNRKTQKKRKKRNKCVRISKN